MSTSLKTCRLLHGYCQLCPSLPSPFTHSEALVPLHTLYDYFPSRINNFPHPDSIAPSLEVASKLLSLTSHSFSIDHICLIHTTYRRSILNHLSFSDYFSTYLKLCSDIVSIFKKSHIEYIFFSDTPHHLEQVILLSAASYLDIKSFSITGTGVSHLTGFIYETSANHGIVNILKSDDLSIDWGSNGIPSPISLDNPLPDFNLHDYYGLGIDEEKKNVLREKFSKTYNYFMYGEQSREHKQFLLFRYYQEHCYLDFDKLVSQPFVLFLLHYEPEAVVDHFSSSNCGQINSILNACSLIKDRGIRLLVKEHPVTFTHSFSNGENHVPLFRTTSDYERLLDYGCQFISNRYKCDDFLVSPNLLCVSSIASTALYEAQLKSKFIYPLGTSIYNMSRYCLDKVSFELLSQYQSPHLVHSSMDDYLVPNLYFASNSSETSGNLFPTWFNFIDRLILSYIY